MRGSIKFRGKSLRDNEWVYGLPCRELMTDNDDALAIIPGAYDGGGVTIEETSLGQFTGVYDVNGKEVYEGDIVKTEKYIGKVKWQKGKCCFQISPYGIFLFPKVEVIGNIYDNPELIK